MARTKNKITRNGNRIFLDDSVDILKLAEDHRFCVKSVCSEIGLTTLQFETLMLKYLEIKPKDLFCKHRAVLARRLMKEGTPMQAISSFLGFKNYSHFCLEIKRFYGTSPRKLSKQLISYQQ